DGGDTGAIADDTGTCIPAGRYNPRATPRCRNLRTFAERLNARVPSGPSTMPCGLGKTKGPASGPFVQHETAGWRHFLAGWTPGLSLKNCLFMSVNFFH